MPLYNPAGNVVTGAVDNAALRADGAGGSTMQASPLIIADTTGAISRSGNGGIPVQGTNTNNAAVAGNVGEYIESVIATGSAVSLTTATGANVTSISLTAGDWDVRGTVHLKAAATTNIMLADVSISTVSATTATATGTYASLSGGSAGLVPNTTVNPSLHVVPTRLLLSGTTTVYLVVQSNFTVDTLAAFGAIGARRMR